MLVGFSEIFHYIISELTYKMEKKNITIALLDINIKLDEDLEKLKSSLIPMNTYDEREKLYKNYVSDIRQLIKDELT